MTSGRPMHLAGRYEDRSVVLFGAGCIGRGLLARLTSRAGYLPVLVEAVSSLVRQLNSAQQYGVRLVGREPNVQAVRDYVALSTMDREAVRSAIQHASFAATAVGGVHLDTVAALLVPGILLRHEPLNILVCENWPSADEVLAEHLMSIGIARERFACIPCVVEPMARPVQGSLDIVQEAGQPLYACQRRWLGDRPCIEGLVFVNDLEAYANRKLYTNNGGHAVLGFEGQLHGCVFLHEALGIRVIYEDAMSFLDLSSEIMVRHFGFRRESMTRHVGDLLSVRYGSRELSDRVTRVARDPLRKLKPQERLMGLLRLLQKYHLPTAPVSKVIGAALNYVSDADQESLTLDTMVRRQGIEAVLQQVCGLEPDERCYQECLQYYLEWAKYRMKPV